MNASAPSLLTFLDAPIVVGDPQGCVTYVNPAFEALFAWSAEEALGRPLAALFEGGTREGVLGAVAEVCSKGETVRFRFRYEGRGFIAVASPIQAGGQRIGVVILLTASAAEDERCLSLHRDLDDPMAELNRSLDELLEATGGRRSVRYRSMVEDGLRALERVKKTNAALRAVLSGAPESKESEAVRLDALQVLEDASARVREKYAVAAVDLEVLIPSQLPPVQGDPERLLKALVRLLDNRLQSVRSGDSVILAARATGRGDATSVVVTIVDSNGPNNTGDAQPLEDTTVADLVRSLGGDLRTTHDTFVGTTTAIRLRAAESAEAVG